MMLKYQYCKQICYLIIAVVLLSVEYVVKEHYYTSSIDDTSTCTTNSCRFVVTALVQVQVQVQVQHKKWIPVAYNRNQIKIHRSRVFMNNSNNNNNNRNNKILNPSHQSMSALEQSPQPQTGNSRLIPSSQSVLDTISKVLQQINVNSIVCSLVLVMSTILFIPLNDNTSSIVWAAPPFAVIAEELGYYPIRNPDTGIVIYVPQRVQRDSTKQAIELAKRLKDKNVYMAGTYWCPHTTRQKELFGKQAYNNIQYLECASAGYQSKANICLQEKVDGYPTWIFPDGSQISGERSLSVLASAVGMKNFNEQLEINVPPLLGSESCK